MIQENNHTLIFSESDVLKIHQPTSATVINYSEVLEQYRVDFRKADNYLEVGEVDWVQGWILDISVVCSQILSLLERALPLLIRENVPFRLVRNSQIAQIALEGGLGLVDLGKIISIYPRSADNALQLARQLIPLTSAFKGPEIPTDRQLNNVVYTRFGACKPIIRINHLNIDEKYIYDRAGNLIKEPLSIPFNLPDDVNWPFRAIVPPQPMKKETVLQDKYRPMAVIKEDTKGSVRKGLMLQKMLKISWCVIKEGKRCMLSDEWGRDIHDRLHWQYVLHKDLIGCIPVPKVYDIFQENGNTYLVMEHVRGVPLITKVMDIFISRLWSELFMPERLLLLDYAEQVLDIIEAMNAKGYIHRDIMPNNFLVDRHQRLWVIDLELSYSQRLQKPFPPFRLGTPGFMSPEQQAGEMPTQAQDIYAIGSILILLLTGLFPNGFSIESENLLKKQLFFFLKDQVFVNVIINCLSYDPQFRPNLALLKTNLQQFRDRQQRVVNTPNVVEMKFSNGQLKIMINYALNALSTPILMSTDNMWHSKKVEAGGPMYDQSKPICVYKGLSQGLSGILYVLSKAHQAGFSIEACMEGYKRSVAYIRPMTIDQISDAPGGLYAGTTGVAIALSEALKGGIISKTAEIKKDILLCLKNRNLVGYDMANGLAGKGLALLNAAEIIDNSLLAPLLETTLDELLLQQQRNGSWISSKGIHKKSHKITGWSHGMGGIAFFLLEYLRRHKDNKVEQAVIHCLRWLLQKSYKKNGEPLWDKKDKNKFIDTGMLNGFPGIILCLIKAYEVLGDHLYRQLAEKGLSTIPVTGVTIDLTLASGLAGIGELYLEAAKVFRSEQWQSRANQVAEFLLHYVVMPNESSCYWLTIEPDFPTADLFNGNCGIIHFLLRCHQPSQLSHPLTIV